MTVYTTINQIKEDVNNSICTVYYKSLNYFVDIDKDGDFIIKCNNNASQELLTDKHNPNDFFNNLKTTTMKYYIEYLDCKNKFRQTKVEFETEEQAKKWMLKNLEKYNEDCIRMY